MDKVIAEMTADVENIRPTHDLIIQNKASLPLNFVQKIRLAKDIDDMRVELTLKTEAGRQRSIPTKYPDKLM